MTVLQAGRIVTNRYQELCLVRNISAGGMMAEIYAPLDPDETVGIEFKAGWIVAGTVRWVEDRRAGIEFLDPIDVHKVLSTHSGKLSPRSPRLSIDASVDLEINEDTVISVDLVDISQGGVKVKQQRRLQNGQELVVVIDGLPERAARVCWTSATAAGIAFHRVIPIDQIACWAARQAPNDVLATMLNAAAEWRIAPSERARA